MRKQELPAAFVRQMESLLGSDTEAFLDSYEQPRTHGLRFNGLKLANAPQLKEAVIREFGLTPVPWCSTGYYYGENVRPGKHPYHTAGLYYIQEPSAMSAVELLDPQPGETILDLAAAPGGKSTHIASKMKGEGLLVSNEIHPERAKILAENIERMGVTSAVVTSAAPDELSRRFPQAFDRIMLDAPCSGEGMFRKDSGAIAEWTPQLVELCAARQWDILQEAYAMLKPGGTMAYSTCTFNRSENEDMMERFTAYYADMEIIAMKRLWPHREAGEGHFVALLQKQGEPSGGGHTLEASPGERQRPRRKGRSGNGKPGAGLQDATSALKAFQAWADEELPDFALPAGTPILFGESLYLLPGGELLQEQQLQGLKVPRAGLHLAHLKKNRIEPAHALAIALSPQQAAKRITLAAEAPQVSAYLRGETLQVDASLKGWVLAAVDGLPLGWGKASSGQLKNHLPKGLRQH